MKVKEIRDLIDYLSNSGLEEVNIETEEFKIKIKRSNDVQVITTAVPPVHVPAVAPVTVPTAASPEEPADNSKYVEIKSPMIGTFYRSANPESPMYVNVGDKISAGSTICIVEAMKLFNEIESEISGTIVKVLAEDSQPVEYDQPLFLVDPS